MIDIVEKVSLGGLNQKIHIKGYDDKNPVLLFLHGGPGMSNRHSVINENGDLFGVFTIVAWDQRGTCGSYKGASENSLTIDRLTDDAKELVDYLCKKFKKKKIFVIGGSWGSLLGTCLLYKYPEKIAAFVGFGQFVNGHMNELISWNFCMDEAKKAGNEEDVKKLLEIGPPKNGVYVGGYKGMRTQRDIMMKYGGYSKDEGKRSYFDAMIKPILKSGEYTLSDLYGYVKGYKFVLNKMWDEVGAVNFNETHTKFDAPIFIFDGRNDMNTPASLVEEWFSKIEAPRKELHWFENSGHNPMFDEPQGFKALLKEKLLEIAKEEKI